MAQINPIKNGSTIIFQQVFQTPTSNNQPIAKDISVTDYLQTPPARKYLMHLHESMKMP